MPAKSDKQRNLMKMAYAYKKGSLKLNKLPKSLAAKVKDVASGMTEEQLKDYFESVSFSQWLEMINED